MALFDNLAREIIATTTPVSGKANLAQQVGQAAGQVSGQLQEQIAPVAQARFQEQSQKDIGFGEWALDPDRFQWAARLDPNNDRGWGRMIELYQGTDDPKTKKIVAQQINRAIPSKTELKNLYQAQIGEAGLAIRAAGGLGRRSGFDKAKQDALDYKRKVAAQNFKDHQELTKVFEESFWKRLPGFKGIQDRQFAGSMVGDIRQSMTTDAVADGKLLRYWNVLTEGATDINPESINALIERDIRARLNNIDKNKKIKNKSKAKLDELRTWRDEDITKKIATRWGQEMLNAGFERAEIDTSNWKLYLKGKDLRVTARSFRDDNASLYRKTLKGLEVTDDWLDGLKKDIYKDVIRKEAFGTKTSKGFFGGEKVELLGPRYKKL